MARIAKEKNADIPQKKTRKSKRAEAGLPSFSENIRYPLMIVWAAILGMIAVFLSRYIRFHLTGGSLTGGENAEMIMIIDGIIAAGGVFALKQLFAMDDKTLQFSQSVGVLIMVLGMHNLVHAFPKVFTTVFSSEWTQEVLETTEPKSILFRGVSFVLGEPKQPEITLPTIEQPEDLMD